jgi:phage-related protein
VNAPVEKELVWIASSLRDLRLFPEQVRGVMGYALFLAQRGDKHVRAKPLRGYGDAAVLEIVDDYDGDTYRAVYTVRFADTVYVLHAFQKKSKHGVATPRADINLVDTRLKMARALHAKYASLRKEG